MRYATICKNLVEIKTDALLVFAFENENWRTFPLPAKITNYLRSAAVDTKDFTGKEAEFLIIPVQKQFPNLNRLVLVGLGKEDKYSATVLRNVCGKTVRSLKNYPVKTVSLFARKKMAGKNDLSRLGQTIVEGFELGGYQFDRYKTKEDRDKKTELRKIEIVAGNEKGSVQTRKGVKKGKIVSAAAILARDLANQPGNVATPQMLAKSAKTMAEKTGLACEILSEKKMQSLNMNALLSVSKGSSQPPALIVLEHKGGKKRQAPIVFVGKGVTFDSGGISLKPGKNMDEMKFDMSGGATVIGIMQAVAQLKLKKNVVGIVPAVENLPDGKATKPGDIVKSMSGTTIEILNTDAEGRMILADALTFTEKYKPAAVINLATLTGAVVVALGHVAAGIMGNDNDLVDGIKKYVEISGEKVWPFPLYDEYKEQLKSDFADIKNIGQNGAGVITAGAFLSKFTEKYKWAHIDIAGVAWTNSVLPVAPKGATGFGVRLLLEWLTDK